MAAKCVKTWYVMADTKRCFFSNKIMFYRDVWISSTFKAKSYDDKSAAMATIWQVRTDICLAQMGPEVEAGLIHFGSIWLWVINKKSDIYCWYMMSLLGTAGLQLQPAHVISSEQETRQGFALLLSSFRGTKRVIISHLLSLLKNYYFNCSEDNVMSPWLIEFHSR